MLYVSILNFPAKELLVKRINDFFKYNYKVEWLNDPYVCKMIKDVDNTDIIQDGCLLSPIFGYMAPDRLSRGVKTLICIYKYPQPKIYLGTAMGDNCYPWVLDMAKTKDIYLFLRYIPDTLPDEFTAMFLDTKKTTYTNAEFRREFNEIFDRVEPW